MSKMKRRLLLILLLAAICRTKAQTMKHSEIANPLLCDTAGAACGMPGKQSATDAAVTRDKPVKILYFTDPICSSCWGIEPQLRRLKLAYGGSFDIEYRMGGLLPSWDVYNSGGISKPSDVAAHWDEVSGHYDMPIDGDVWLEDPLPSSYPPSIAFKAAQLQDEEKALLFLRRIREMVFMEKKNITRPEHLKQAAIETGLDAEVLVADMHGKAKKAFEDDLDLARQLGVRGFPTVFISGDDNSQLKLYGAQPYSRYEQAVVLMAQGVKAAPPGAPQDLFRQFRTLNTREFIELSGMYREDAIRLLEELEGEGSIRRQISKNGPLWIRKD